MPACKGVTTQQAEYRLWEMQRQWPGEGGRKEGHDLCDRGACHSAQPCGHLWAYDSLAVGRGDGLRGPWGWRKGMSKAECPEATTVSTWVTECPRLVVTWHPHCSRTADGRVGCTESKRWGQGDGKVFLSFLLLLIQQRFSWGLPWIYKLELPSLDATLRGMEPI